MAGKIVGNEACPQCKKNGRDSTSDHLMIFADGGGYCNRCEYYRAPEDETPAPPLRESSMKVNIEELSAAEVPSRGLSKAIVELYGGRVEYDPASREQAALWVPRHKSGQVCGWKRIDLIEKEFLSKGDGKEVDLFGMDMDGGRRLCIITEGELDAIAAKQMIVAAGKDYRVVSLPNGASSSINTDSHAWLSAFETLIIATDMDDPGNAAATKLCEMFEAGKCKRANMPAKDANACLQEGMGQQFFNALMSAQTVTADGIVLSDDTWDAVLSEYRKENTGGIPFMDYMPDLNEMTYGIRTGELDTYTSGSGSGKTQFLRELQYHLAITNGCKVGVMSLEEPLVDTALGQMSIAANLPLHLPDVRTGVSDEDLRGYWEATYGTGQYVVYDHFGSLSDDTLVSKIRYLSSGMGCTHIILDHLSIVVSEYAAHGDERKAIDEIMSKLKRLTQELDINISLVVHLRKASGTPFEQGAVPSVDDLRGSGAIKQLSNQVYALSRNQQHPDPVLRNTTQFTVLKSRFTGRTGPAGLIQYDPDTGRMGASAMTAEDLYAEQSPLNQRG